MATCRICGCTDERACPGGCWWVEPDFCSACAPAERQNETPEMVKKFFSANCCACGGPMRGSRHLNVVVLNKKARWKYPVGGNILDKKLSRAVAVLCDDCIAAEKKPVLAIEFAGAGLVYHAVSHLEDLPPAGEEDPHGG